MNARLARCALMLCLAAAGVSSCEARAPAPVSHDAGNTLKIATWNLEWLIDANELRRLKPGCTGERSRGRAGERSIPCDVAARFARDRNDFAALARYADRLDADVIALQEVDGPEAAAQVFRDHDFCFTRRRHPQNTGFAVRRGLPHRCGDDVVALSLRDTVRSGAELIVYPDDAREMRFLSIHLKSGCGDRLLDAGRKPCAALAQQVTHLERWIDTQARAGRRFAVLGDFNRDLLDEQGPARSARGTLLRFWPEIDDADPPEADLVNAAEGERFVNCSIDKAFSGYIDYIVLSRSLGDARVAGSFERVTYELEDSRRRKLSDHCPVALKIRTLPLVRPGD